VTPYSSRLASADTDPIIGISSSPSSGVGEQEPAVEHADCGAEERAAIGAAAQQKELEHRRDRCAARPHEAQRLAHVEPLPSLVEESAVAQRRRAAR